MNFIILTVLAFILPYTAIATGENKYESTDKNDLADEIMFLLNGTFYHLKDQLCSLQGKVDVLETMVDQVAPLPDVSNNTLFTEFKQMVSRELLAFAKIQSGFENSIRLLQKEQAEIRAFLNSTCRHNGTDQKKDNNYGNCTAGWIALHKKCYYISSETEKTNWESAVTHCKNIGSKLVELKNDKEASHLFQLMPERVGHRDYIYTGEKRDDDENWVYLTDSELVNEGTRTWSPDEPGGPPENCGCVSKEDSLKMTDCHCTGFELLFICEKARATK
ncbi:CD209 antigen-like [Pecten maximus]|uniref:CD209 antigen-like n=1 Tax=Pecten maximus TaxID=6579 RepID=UPI0014590471|nr:CD209 antigen-like [Pecten maximus]